MQAPEWNNYDMPLELQEVQPWGLAVRKDQPDWATYLSTMVTKWSKDGTILDLRAQLPYQTFEIRRGRAPEGILRLPAINGF